MDAVPYAQGYIFFIVFLGGIIFGFSWDIYRVFRYYITLGKKGTALGDVIFCMFCLIVGLKIIIYSSWGNLRWFIFLGFFLGGAFYFYAFSKHVLKFIIYFVKVIVLIFMFIWFLISYPLMLIKIQIKKVLRPYKNKINQNMHLAKRRYKFFRYKVKKVLNDKKLSYNDINKKEKNKHKKKIKKRKKKRIKINKK